MKFIFVFIISCFACLSAHANDFKGYPCTEDCSGHEAGYEWAEDKGITDSSDCGGNSNSFIEGCEAYAEEEEEAEALEEEREEVDAENDRY